MKDGETLSSTHNYTETVHITARMEDNGRFSGKHCLEADSWWKKSTFRHEPYDMLSQSSQEKFRTTRQGIAWFRIFAINHTTGHTIGPLCN
jgi:hypothetical protein